MNQPEVDNLSVRDNTANQEVLYKRWVFPAGEVGIKFDTALVPGNQYSVFLNSGRSDDVMACLQLIDALIREVGPEFITLGIGYLPYGRQDRVCHKGEAFGLELFAKMLAVSGVRFVVVADPHSDVFKSLMIQYGIRCLILTQAVCARDLPKFDVLIAPDAGAREKAQNHRQVATELQENPTKLVQLSKVRKEGRVEYEDLEFDTIEGNVCVIDDMCDGGATFIALADMLHRTQPNIDTLNLYVTHGIFSKGVDELKKSYNQIFVYNLLNPSVINQVKEI